MEWKTESVCEETSNTNEMPFFACKLAAECSVIPHIGGAW